MDNGFDFSLFFKPILIAGAILFMFIVPMMFYFAKVDYDVQTVCDDAVHEFVDKSRTSGYVSANNYNQMIHKMSATGNLYEVHIIHESKICYPGGSSYDSNYYTYTTDEILSDIFDETGAGTHIMKNGDYIKVQYTLKEPTIASKLFGAFSTHTRKSIKGSYGGYVGAALEMGGSPVS